MPLFLPIDFTPARAALERLRPGDYLTDEVDLFRVTALLLADSVPVFAYLEDCRTLEVSSYDARELQALDLRTVETDAGLAAA